MFNPKYLIAIIAVAGTLLCNGQRIQEPSDSYLANPHNYYDPLLVNEASNAKLTFTANHSPVSEATVRYYRLVKPAELDFRVNNSEKAYGYTEVVRGKKQTFRRYDNPYVYYGILDFPEGRYYGLFTTGFNELAYVVNAPISEWHPYGDVRLLEGILEKSDGTKQQLVMLTPGEYDKTLSKKPSGTYHMHDLSGFDSAELTFNAGGVGKLVCKDQHQQIAPQRFAAALNKRKYRNTYGQASGGYYYNIYTTTTVSFKWSLTDDDLLKITFTSKPSIQCRAEVDAAREFENMTISPSDKQREMANHRRDIKTNESVLEDKKASIARVKEIFAQEEGLNIPYFMIGTKTIIMKLTDKDGLSIYPILQKKAFDNTDVWYDETMCDLNNYARKFAERREYGAVKIFPKVKRRLLSAMETTKIPVLSTANAYYIYNLNPNGKTGEISVISNNKNYTASFELDDQFQFIPESISSTITEDSTLADNDALVQQNHAQIIGYKNDKRRSKIAKKYEKKVKKLLPISMDCTSFEQFEQIRQSQEDLLKIQSEFQEMLR